MLRVSDQARREVHAATFQALNLLDGAARANANGYVAEWQTKALQAFILIDVAWKKVTGNCDLREEANALQSMEGLSAAFERRVQALLNGSDTVTVCDANGVAVARRV